ncbi:MAG: hypothetical protein OEQ14_05800 [Gammaproteobacteria bacterium]|nr:hypothetical protein [Gammaproteobacteria bacterium]
MQPPYNGVIREASEKPGCSPPGLWARGARHYRAYGTPMTRSEQFIADPLGPSVGARHRLLAGVDETGNGGHSRSNDGRCAKTV